MSQGGIVREKKSFFRQHQYEYACHTCMPIDQSKGTQYFLLHSSCKTLSSSFHAINYSAWAGIAHNTTHDCVSLILHEYYMLPARWIFYFKVADFFVHFNWKAQKWFLWCFLSNVLCSKWSLLKPPLWPFLFAQPPMEVKLINGQWTTWGLPSNSREFVSKIDNNSQNLAKLGISFSPYLIAQTLTKERQF